MSVFAGYARYYDLLYRDKDYAAESRYVASLIEAFAPGARDVLEIGSGTGGHAAELAAAGYSVCGVDMSPSMLEAAGARRADAPADVAARMKFSLGDARSVRLDRRFDAVISLFHVMSYQTSNADLASAFRTAKEHLRDEGVFIFDCWYGPAVLRLWPSVTVKELSDGTTHVRRVAEPAIDATRNTVDVSYTVTITDTATGSAETLRETHRMRYLFHPEVETALEGAGLRLIDSRGWMASTAPDFSTWGACFIARG